MPFGWPVQPVAHSLAWRDLPLKLSLLSSMSNYPSACFDLRHHGNYFPSAVATHDTVLPFGVYRAIVALPRACRRTVSIRCMYLRSQLDSPLRRASTNCKAICKCISQQTPTCTIGIAPASSFLNRHKTVHSSIGSYNCLVFEIVIDRVLIYENDGIDYQVRSMHMGL